jgi:DNA replication and repair protein RecF
MRVVSLANTDIEMVRGGSEARRRYLDFAGTQLDSRYRPTLRAYERALRSRNALLKSMPLKSRELSAYDLPLIEHGTLLREMRATIVVRLRPFVAAAHAEISGRRETMDLDFSAGNEDDFAAHLVRTHEEEKRLRQTIAGPHRDDLDLYIDGMSTQAYASEGQQRTLALALKIGQARLFGEGGDAPLLLIDDIFGELDPSRRDRLLEALPGGAQKLVTSTTRQWPDRSVDGPLFQLGGGAVSILK